MKEKLYWYRGVVDRVYDADTIICSVDLGLGVWRRNERLRLANIDAWEVRDSEKPKGLAARDALNDLVKGKEVLLFSHKDKSGKHGRFLVDLYVPVPEYEEWRAEHPAVLYIEGDPYIHINKWLVQVGHAVEIKKT